MALRRQARTQALGQRRRMRLDARDADSFQVRKGGAELIHLSEGQGGVLEAPGGLVQVEAAIAARALDVQSAKAVQADSVQQVAPNVKRRHPKSAQQPLVGTAAHHVDTSRLDIRREHSHRLDAISVEERTMRVS